MSVELPVGVELESARCPLCDTSADDPVLEGCDRLHGLPGRFSVVRCRGCGLLRTDPRPTPLSMRSFYPDTYGPFHGTRAGSDDGTGCGDPGRERRFLDFRTNPIPPLSPGRMLEIGCASGAFLQKMARAGWEVAGIESSETAAQNARSLGYAVQASTVEEAAAPTRAYDLIVGFMVLEHLHDPLHALSRLRAWARPGGWLVLSVPNAGSLGGRLFRGAWYDLDLPRHLYHFTPQTLRTLLDAAGWKPERLMHQRILSDLFVSLGYRFRDLGFRGAMTRALLDVPDMANRWPLHPVLYPVATLLAAAGQTGRMTVWARRP